MTDTSEDRKKLIAEIKAQYPDMNKRVYEVIASYSMEDLKTVKETMKYDNEQFQYRLNNQEVTIQNTKDNSLKMTITGENGETMQVYDGDNRSSMIVSDDDGEMVINTNKNTNRTTASLNVEGGNVYIDENNVEVVEVDENGNEIKVIDIERDGDDVRATFVSDSDVHMEISAEGRVDENGRFSGKIKGVDKEYKEELSEQTKKDYPTEEEYELAKGGGEFEVDVENDEVIRVESRDFIDYSPKSGSEHDHIVARKDENGNIQVISETVSYENNNGIVSKRVVVDEGKEQVNAEEMASSMQWIDELRFQNGKSETQSHDEERNQNEVLNQEEKSSYPLSGLNRNIYVIEDSYSGYDNENGNIIEKTTTVKGRRGDDILYKADEKVTTERIYFSYNAANGSFQEAKVVESVAINREDDENGNIVTTTYVNGKKHGIELVQNKEVDILGYKLYNAGEEINLEGKNVSIDAIDGGLSVKVDGNSFGVGIGCRSNGDAYVSVYPDIDGNRMKIAEDVRVGARIVENGEEKMFYDPYTATRLQENNEDKSNRFDRQVDERSANSSNTNETSNTNSNTVNESSNENSDVEQSFQANQSQKSRVEPSEMSIYLNSKKFER